MNDISLSCAQKQIILGGLLGDSYFNKEKCSIGFSQCEKQLSYLKWKYDFFCTKAKILSTYNTWRNQKYLRYFFYLSKKYIDNETIVFIKKNMYSNKGRKKISLKYLSQLNELGLAVWWMDDGCMCVDKNRKNRYGKLCTHCFNFEENILIQKYFKNKWGINVTIQKEKKYNFIRFSATELKKMIKLIYPYVCEIPSMIYKIDMKYKNKGSIGKEYEKMYFYIEEHKPL